MADVKKVFVSGNDLVADSFALAKKVLASGYDPEVLVCMWRGGTPVGIVVHEFLLYKGIETDHIAIKASSYFGIEEREDVLIEHMESFVYSMGEDSRTLVVDDIFDTGHTMKKVCEALKRRTKNVKTATLYYKPGKSEDGEGPDFYLHETQDWVVFPHELVGLSSEEIMQKGDFAKDLLD
jgi:hypoxanthine phosphoribosyltransferase